MQENYKVKKNMIFQLHLSPTLFKTFLKYLNKRIKIKNTYLKRNPFH